MHLVRRGAVVWQVNCKPKFRPVAMDVENTDRFYATMQSRNIESALNS